MPHFSKTSKKRLATCHQDLQVIFNIVIEHFDCKILAGHRNEEDQNHAYWAGHSEVKWPDSYHNTEPSDAVDAVPYPIEWKNTDRMKFFVGFVLGIAEMLYQEGIINSQIVSGLDWDDDTFLKDHKFKDHPHFQIKR